MKFILSRKLVSLILITILSLSTMGFARACDEDKEKKVNRALDTIAESEKRVASFIKEAKETGTLSEADVNLLKPYLIAINDGNREAIQIAKSMLTDPSASRQTELSNAISRVSISVVRLNDQGTLRIKDPQKRLLFNGLVLAIQGAVSSAVLLLELGKDK